MKHAFALTALTLTASFITPQAHAGPTLDPIFTFENPVPEADDSFGISVALNADYAVVGAQLDSTGGLFNGRAYVFDPNSGTLLRTLAHAVRTTRDGFGAQVAIDGDLVAVSAPFADNDPSGTFGDNVGRAYAFDLGSGTSVRQFNAPFPQISAQFGDSIAIDNGRILVGAPQLDVSGNLNEGQAVLFDISSGAILRTFNDPTPTTSDLFGIDVSLRGDLALIGAAFDDGNGTNAGAVHLYNVQTGALLNTFTAPQADDNNRFGINVQLGDGFALIGANSGTVDGEDQGRIFLFDTETGALLRTFQEPSPGSFGNINNNLAFDGDFIVASNTNARDVGLFRASTGELIHRLEDPDPDTGSFFGASVAISGNQLLIGAGSTSTSGDNLGRAYLYDISSITGTTQVPLPATLALLGMGLLGVGVVRRKTR